MFRKLPCLWEGTLSDRSSSQRGLKKMKKHAGGCLSWSLSICSLTAQGSPCLDTAAAAAAAVAAWTTKMTNAPWEGILDPVLELPGVPVRLAMLCLNQDELVRYVMSFLDEDGIAEARQVSHRWKAAATTDTMRKQHDRNIVIRKYEDGKPPTLFQEPMVVPGDHETLPSIWDGHVMVAPNGTVVVAHDLQIQVYNNQHHHLRTIDFDSNARCHCISPAGNEIYSGFSGEIRAYKFDGTYVRTLTVVPDPPTIDWLAFGFDWKLYATTKHGKFFVWGDDGRLLHTWKNHSGVATCLLPPNAHSAGGFYSGDIDSTITKWNAEGDLQHTLEGHTGRVRCLVFGPGGDKLYSASDDRSIRVWGPEGKPLQIFEGHTDSVFCLAFSSDGRLYSGGLDQTIKVWSMGGTLLRTLGHGNLVTSLALCQDNSKLYSASCDGKINAW